MLKDRIKQDSVLALKSGNQRDVDALRYLVSLLDKKELSMEAGLMTEEDEVNVLRKEMKNKEESVEMFVKGGRDDLAADVRYEITLLSQYLPTELTEDEVRSIVEEIKAIKGSVFGVVMGETMKRIAGRASGDKVARVVKECLAI